MLTREEILAMVPGRELDAKVAQAIGYVSMTTQLNHDGTYGTLPFFSTNITSAWVVLENLKESNDCVTLAWGQDSWQCHVCLFLPMNEEYEFNSKESMYDSPSAPEAICKAALLSLLEKGNEAS